MILLSPFDLGIAAVLLIMATGLTAALRLGLTRTLVIAACRTALQLLLIGYVLKVLFTVAHPGWVAGLALIMLSVAGWEVVGRQHRRLSGWWGVGIGSASMFLSAFTVTVLALTVVIEAQPWYTPQYAIPLLGMVLGNVMNGVALGLDRLTQTTWEQRAVIEARLMLGQDWNEAISDIRRHSVRTGTIPIVNAMAAAGIVSLPGMMTGQILAGIVPVEAAKYQILIMFLISAGTVIGTVGAVWLGSRRLFDTRQRLRLDRIGP
jgi:putative ABC transport system permease protein